MQLSISTPEHPTQERRIPVAEAIQITRQIFQRAQTAPRTKDCRQIGDSNVLRELMSLFARTELPMTETEDRKAA